MRNTLGCPLDYDALSPSVSHGQFGTGVVGNGQVGDLEAIAEARIFMCFSFTPLTNFSFLPFSSYFSLLLSLSLAARRSRDGKGNDPIPSFSTAHRIAFVSRDAQEKCQQTPTRFIRHTAPVKKERKEEGKKNDINPLKATVPNALHQFTFTVGVDSNEMPYDGRLPLNIARWVRLCLGHKILLLPPFITNISRQEESGRILHKRKMNRTRKNKHAGLLHIPLFLSALSAF